MVTTGHQLLSVILSSPSWQACAAEARYQRYLDAVLVRFPDNESWDPRYWPERGNQLTLRQMVLAQLKNDAGSLQRQVLAQLIEEGLDTKMTFMDGSDESPPKPRVTREARLNRLIDRSIKAATQRGLDTALARDLVALACEAHDLLQRLLTT
jgi:hypothetical protein